MCQFSYMIHKRLKMCNVNLNMINLVKPWWDLSQNCIGWVSCERNVE